MTGAERVDTWAAVHPAWRPRLRDLCSRTGVRLGSVWRSEALQAHWHACALAGCKGLSNCHGVPDDCPSANPPGHSLHETCEVVVGVPDARLRSAELEVADMLDTQRRLVPCVLAVDLSWDGTEPILAAHRLAPDLGLHFPVFDATGKEEWHVQPVEAPESSATNRFWSPFRPLADWVNLADPWDDLFVVLI